MATRWCSYLARPRFAARCVLVRLWHAGGPLCCCPLRRSLSGRAGSRGASRGSPKDHSVNERRRKFDHDRWRDDGDRQRARAHRQRFSMDRAAHTAGAAYLQGFRNPAGRPRGTNPPRTAIRLYPFEDFQRRPEHDALRFVGASCHRRCSNFAFLAQKEIPWFEAPPPDAIAAAEALLDRLGMDPDAERLADCPCIPDWPGSSWMRTGRARLRRRADSQHC